MMMQCICGKSMQGKRNCAFLCLQNTVSPSTSTDYFLTSHTEDLSVPLKWCFHQSDQTHEQATFGQAEVRTSKPHQLLQGTLKAYQLAMVKVRYMFPFCLRSKTPEIIEG